jgi:hypothetical protein
MKVSAESLFSNVLFAFPGGKKLTWQSAVSDPNHDRYGQHLSSEEVHELIKPSSEGLDLVNEWLIINGVDQFDYSPAKDWVNIYISVADAERLLDTEYSVFQHDDGSYLVRTPEWSLPSHLFDVVETVQPTNARRDGLLPDTSPRRTRLLPRSATSPW